MKLVINIVQLRQLTVHEHTETGKRLVQVAARDPRTAMMSGNH